MTYFVYAVWFLSLLLVAGELDHRFSRHLSHRFMPEISASAVWYLPPSVSFILPGAGQFLNGQIIKALVAFTWPITVGLLPRPWQFLMVKTWIMLVPWYIIVVLDALLVGVMTFRRQLREEHAHREEQRGKVDSLGDYLTRRRATNHKNGS